MYFRHLLSSDFLFVKSHFIQCLWYDQMFRALNTICFDIVDHALNTSCQGRCLCFIRLVSMSSFMCYISVSRSSFMFYLFVSTSSFMCYTPKVVAIVSRIYLLSKKFCFGLFVLDFLPTAASYLTVILFFYAFLSV